MNQTMEEAIVRAKAVFEQVTGARAREPTPNAPYARIPPEVDAEEYVTMKAASLLERVRSLPRSNGKPEARDLMSSAVTVRVGPTLPIPAAVIRGESEVRWLLEMPGVPRSTIEVELLGSTLSVTGERPVFTLDQGDRVLTSDLTVGRVERVLTLPTAVDPSQVQATLIDGYLTVRVRLPASLSRPQKIEVR